MVGFGVAAMLSVVNGLLAFVSAVHRRVYFRLFRAYAKGDRDMDVPNLRQRQSRFEETAMVKTQLLGCLNSKHAVPLQLSGSSIELRFESWRLLVNRGVLNDVFAMIDLSPPDAIIATKSYPTWYESLP